MPAPESHFGTHSKPAFIHSQTHTQVVLGEVVGHNGEFLLHGIHSSDASLETVWIPAPHTPTLFPDWVPFLLLISASPSLCLAVTKPTSQPQGQEARQEVF